MIMMESGKLELDRTKEGVKKYWDYGSKFYDTAPGSGGDDENQMWKELLSGAIGQSPKNILDVGSGTGIIAMYLAELGHGVTAVDFSEGMMDVARKKKPWKREQTSDLWTGMSRTLASRMRLLIVSQPGTCSGRCHIRKKR